MSDMNLNNIARDRDLYGREIAVGDLVRSFDFPFAMSDTEFMGFDLDGERSAYVEGLVTAIGDDEIEGCARYRIAALRLVQSGKMTDLNVAGEEIPFIYPPLNGTPSMMGRATCGVLKVVAEATPIDIPLC